MRYKGYLGRDMRLVISFVFCLVLTGLSAQDHLKSVSLGYSVNSYSGDFSGYTKLRSGLHFGYHFNPTKRISGLCNLRLGRVVAEQLEEIDEVERLVNTGYFGLNFGLDFKLLTIKELFSFHIVPGVGFIRYNPKDAEGNDLLSNNSSRAQNESYSNFSIMLPVLLSSRIKLSDSFGIQVSTGFLNTRTDYLDNGSELFDATDKDNVFVLDLGVYFTFKGKEPVRVTNE